MSKKNVINDVDTGKTREWLTGDGKKILVYHRDSDGVCSAAVLMKLFPEFEAIPREGPIIDKKFFDYVVSEKPELLVFMDIPADQEWEKLLDMKEEVPDIKIMIIDHHTIEKDMNLEENFIHINPRFLKKEYYIPTSCIIYELLDKFEYDVEPVFWVSLTGVIGDYGTKDCAWMFEKYAKNGEVTQSQLTKASEIISSAITLKGLDGAKKVLDIILKSDGYGDFEKSGDLKKWNKIVQKEVRAIINDFEKNKEVFDKEGVIFYEIKSRLNITSIIATITAEKYPDDILIIWKKSSENLYKFSLRYQTGRVSVGELAKWCTKGIGSGGGHIKSAGACANSMEEFKNRVFEYLKLFGD